MSFREWEEVKLSDICTYRTGKLNSNAAEVKGKYPFFTCSPETLRIDCFSFDQDAVLLAGNNANGVFSIKHYCGKFDAYQRTYIINSTNYEKLNNKFLYYALSLQLNYLQNISVGSATKFLTKTILDNITINVPLDSREMRYIAHILSTLDEKIEVNNQINKTLEKMAQSIFKHWFVDFEFPNEAGDPYQSSGGEMVDSELGLVPKGWKVGILGDLIQITSGKRPPKRSDKNENNFIFPLVGASSVMGFSEEYNFNEAVLVIGRVGTHGIIQRFERRIWASDNTLVIRSKMYEYVYQILNSIDYSALNRGSTQPLITQTDIKNYSILVPSLSVLNNFQITVGTLFKSTINNQNENEILKNIRDILLPKLMFGEIRVQLDLSS